MARQSASCSLTPPARQTKLAPPVRPFPAPTRWEAAVCSVPGASTRTRHPPSSAWSAVQASQGPTTPVYQGIHMRFKSCLDGGAGAADRDRRDTEGHQQLTDRSQPVFDAVVRERRALCGADVAMFRLEGNGHRA